MTKDELLLSLKRMSQSIAKMALVAENARTLPEWCDATDAMSTLLETAGDLCDRAESSYLGFVNNVRKVTPMIELQKRGDELLAEIHAFCGAPLYPDEGLNNA